VRQAARERRGAELTPVVPFDPARTPTGEVRASLKDAYSEEAIRSFVRKLRYLASDSPNTCAAQFQLLDDELTRMWTPAYAVAATTRLERRRKNTRSWSPEWLCAVLQRFARERPAAGIVIERLVADMVDILEREAKR